MSTRHASKVGAAKFRAAVIAHFNNNPNRSLQMSGIKAQFKEILDETKWSDGALYQQLRTMVNNKLIGNKKIGNGHPNVYCRYEAPVAPPSPWAPSTAPLITPAPKKKEVPRSAVAAAPPQSVELHVGGNIIVLTGGAVVSVVMDAAGAARVYIGHKGE